MLGVFLTYKLHTNLNHAVWIMLNDTSSLIMEDLFATTQNASGIPKIMVSYTPYCYWRNFVKMLTYFSPHLIMSK